MVSRLEAWSQILGWCLINKYTLSPQGFFFLVLFMSCVGLLNALADVRLGFLKFICSATKQLSLSQSWVLYISLPSCKETDLTPYGRMEKGEQMWSKPEIPRGRGAQAAWRINDMATPTALFSNCLYCWGFHQVLCGPGHTSWVPACAYHTIESICVFNRILFQLGLTKKFPFHCS